MENTKNNRFSQAVDIKEEIINGIISIRFHDFKIEEEFNNYLIKNSRKMRMMTNVVSLIILFVRIFFNFSKPIIHYFYFVDLGLGIISIIIYISMNFLIKNLKIAKILSYLFSIFIIILYSSTFIFLNYYFKNKHISILIRESYIVLLISIIELLNSVEYNFFFILILFIINFGISIFIFIRQYCLNYNNQLKDLFAFFFVLLICVLKNKLNTFIVRENYLLKFKDGSLLNYTLDILNNINGFYIAIKKGKFQIFNTPFEYLIKNPTVFNEFCQKNEKEINELKENNNFSKPGICELNENYKKITNQNTFAIRKVIQRLNFKIETEKNKGQQPRNEISNLKNYENVLNYKKRHSIKNKIFVNNKSFLRENEEINNISGLKYNKIECIDNKNFQQVYFNLKNKEKNFNEENIDVGSKSKEDNKSKNELNYQLKNDLISKNLLFDSLFLNECFDEISDELCELYFRNLQLKLLCPDFLNLKENNLFSLYNELNKEKSSYLNQGKFVFLGEFFIKHPFKYFEVFIRKNNNFENMIEFLIYDNTQVKEAENSEVFLKSKFFAKIAHEFKTPINSIIGLINKMYTNFPLEKSNLTFKKTLNQIESLSNYVIILIQDIIEYSKIFTMKKKLFDEHKKSPKLINLKISKINLKDIIYFCKDILKTILRTKNKEKYIQINTFFDERIFEYDILSDELRLKQIFLNLISNAVKFTNTGSIMIQTELVDEGKKKNSLQPFVKVSIIDTGIRIKDLDVAKLFKFEKLGKLDFPINCCQESFGLGLSMSKYLIDILNHDMEIQTTYGKGSSFSIILKARRIQESNVSLNFEDNKSKRLYSSDNIHERGKINGNSKTIYSNYFYNKSFDKHLLKKKKKSSLLSNDSSKRRSKQFVNYDGNKYFRKLLENIDENIIQNLIDSPKFKSDKHIHISNILNIGKCTDKNFNYLKDFENKKQKDNNIFIKKFKENKSYNNYSSSLLNKLKNMKNSKKDSRIKMKLEKSFIKKSFNCSSDFHNFYLESNDDDTIKVSNHFENPYKNNIEGFHYSSSNNLSEKEKNKHLDLCSRSKGTNSEGYSDNYVCHSRKSKFCESLMFKNDRESSMSREFKLKNKNRRIILIADDHVYIRDSLKNIINKILTNKNLNKDFVVKEVSDGIEIINFVLKDQFTNNLIKCLITDENMEFINGSEALKILKNLQLKNKIKYFPIASITAFQDDLMKSMILSNGVDLILPKPCTENNLDNFFDEFKVFRD